MATQTAAETSLVVQNSIVDNIDHIHTNNSTEDEYKNVEQIARRLASAKTKEEFLRLLTQISGLFFHSDHDSSSRIIHDEYLMEGAAEGLVKSLHHALVLREGTQRNYYRTSLSHNGALQCTVLVTAIEVLLRCSPNILAEHREILQKDLGPVLPRLLELFVAWDGGDSLRAFAIGEAIQVMRRISPLFCPHHLEFVQSLLTVLKGHVAPDIQVSAATTMSILLHQQERSIQRKKLMESIQNDSSLLISTLSTAAMRVSNAGAEEVLTGLFNFAVNSHSIRVKMAKRRCTILAIGKHLSSTHVENRKLALNICKCLLNHDHSSSSSSSSSPPSSPPPLGVCTNALQDNTSNSKLLIDKIMDSALHEPETMLRLYAISLLGDAVSNPKLLSRPIKESIMSVLEDIANSDGPDEPSTEASIAYLKSAAALPPAELSQRHLATIADFTTLPYARSRTMAIQTLEFMTSDEDIAEALLQDTEMLENFSLIISFGSDEDCADALHVMKLLAEDERHHKALCQKAGFLKAVVELVTNEEVVNQTAYIHGVETILALLSNHKNVQSFLPFIDLLPTLVSLANTTADDEPLKERFVSAIVRLSSAILDI